ncbi:hypothetical protein Spb1_20560 [Planctopirus ephydatiae]|uniref:Uncharacterized protein n=1 Tax=Planctopirus ephydatiae TaxID=2528019 RepID=A0A518GND6_9PLAN|nr:hypothetical protein [Planctopirus ephydatiae]QDV30128.1 hypothetical protein Spb1_20560 [Planctopirus ephydatiae]
MKVAGKLFEQLPGLQIDLRKQADCIRKEAKMQRCACAQNLGRLAGFPRLARGPPEKIVRLCVV